MEQQIGNVVDVLQCIIVDDEQEACNNLLRCIDRSGQPIRVAGIANTTAEAEHLIDNIKPDVVFLDINMPRENAFQFLERINHHNFEIVFVTAYDEFAIKALRLNAVDYILKPIDQAEINNTLKRLYTILKNKRAYNSIKYFSEAIQNSTNKITPQKITFKDTNGSEVVHFDELIYIEAKGSYSTVVIKNGGNDKTIVVSHPIAEYEELLPQDLFFRVHKSYLVNGMYINKILKNESSIIVASKYTIPVSRRRYADMILFLKKISK